MNHRNVIVIEKTNSVPGWEQGDNYCLSLKQKVVCGCVFSSVCA